MPANSQVCLEANSLGLEHGNRIHPFVLKSIWIKMSFCEGDIIHPVIRSSTSSQVVVLSLMSDGTAFGLAMLVTKNNVSSELDLGAFEVVPSSSSGEERLVVVGVPEKEKFGIFQEMNLFCN